MAKLVSRVIKRDGSIESFDLPRLSDSLRAAVGEDPALDGLAEQLASSIHLSLGQELEAVECAEIARCAANALQATGQARAASDYVAFRLGLEAAVERLRVHTRNGEERRARHWDRRRLALSLARDRSLDLASARKISGMIERRLVMADLRHVTGRLVASLSDNECRSLGLRSDPLDEERVGIDRRQLRAWLGGECMPSGSGAPLLGPEGEDLRPRLGEELLARFASEEVLSAPQAQAVAAGQFYLPGIGDWIRPARIRLRPVADEGEEAFWDRVAEAREQTPEVQVFWPAGHAHARHSQEAPAWLRQAGTRLRLATAQAQLALQWAAADHWVRMPARAFADASEALQRDLAASGRVQVVWQPPRRLPAARDQTREVLDGVAVLNLASAANRAEAWQEGNFLSILGEVTELSCRALQGLAMRGRSLEHPRVSLLPAGLDRALAALYPGGASSDRRRRLLHSVRSLLERYAGNAGLRLEHAAPPHPGPAGAHLAAIDGLAADQAYLCGWLDSATGGVPARSLFDAAPWLQFPAAAALADASWNERLPRSSDLAES